MHRHQQLDTKKSVSVKFMCIWATVETSNCSYEITWFGFYFKLFSQNSSQTNHKVAVFFLVCFFKWDEMFDAGNALFTVFI